MASVSKLACTSSALILREDEVTVTPCCQINALIKAVVERWTGPGHPQESFHCSRQAGGPAPAGVLPPLPLLSHPRRGTKKKPGEYYDDTGFGLRT